MHEKVHISLLGHKWTAQLLNLDARFNSEAIQRVYYPSRWPGHLTVGQRDFCYWKKTDEEVETEQWPSENYISMSHKQIWASTAVWCFIALVNTCGVVIFADFTPQFHSEAAQLLTELVQKRIKLRFASDEFKSTPFPFGKGCQRHNHVRDGGQQTVVYSLVFSKALRKCQQGFHCERTDVLCVPCHWVLCFHSPVLSTL